MPESRVIKPVKDRIRSYRDDDQSSVDGVSRDLVPVELDDVISGRLLNGRDFVIDASEVVGRLGNLQPEQVCHVFHPAQRCFQLVCHQTRALLLKSLLSQGRQELLQARDGCFDAGVDHAQRVLRLDGDPEPVATADLSDVTVDHVAKGHDLLDVLNDLEPDKVGEEFEGGEGRVRAVEVELDAGHRLDLVADDEDADPLRQATLVEDDVGNDAVVGLLFVDVVVVARLLVDDVSGERPLTQEVGDVEPGVDNLDRMSVIKNSVFRRLEAVFDAERLFDDVERQLVHDAGLPDLVRGQLVRVDLSRQAGNFDRRRYGQMDREMRQRDVSIVNVAVNLREKVHASVECCKAKHGSNI